MRGKQQSLWRAVDQDGHGLAILAQSRRNAKTVCPLPLTRNRSRDCRIGDAVPGWRICSAVTGSTA
ncbi:MAG: hypothetical protein INR62_13165 [Rhodospirillales bacterium]|nr:hypothetical protein [Acetobacter sp.]